MNRRTFNLALSLGVAALLVPTLTLADERLASAIRHSRTAVTQGTLGYGGLSAYHASLPLEDAEAAEKQKANSHTEEAIVHLKAAIEEGNQKHAEAAAKHAEEALHQLELAEK